MWASKLKSLIYGHLHFTITNDLRPAIKSFGDNDAVTPNIDKLSTKSFQFRNAFAQQALCAPSRNSFLTSRRPDSLHLYDFDNYWRSFAGNFTTLPQHFKNNGYFTHSIGKIFHPGASSNYTDDFPYSWSQKPFHPKTEAFMNAKTCIDSNGNYARNLICPVIVESQPMATLPDMESLIAAQTFLKNAKSLNKSYFLAVGFHKPHIPFKFPYEYLNLHPLDKISLPKNRFRSSSLPTTAWNPWTDIRERDDFKKLNVSFPYGPVPDDFTKQILQAYRAATSYVDDLIGQLLRYVDKNTIIVLLGDHGWSLAEHGEFAKYSNYEVATKVPLLIHVPGLVSHEIISYDLVELVDIFPTLVDLTQISSPLITCPLNGTIQLCTEGRSLVPLMVEKLGKKGNYIKKAAIFTQYPRPGPYPTMHPNSDKPKLKDIKIMGYSIQTGQHRYCEWVEFNSKSLTANWTRLYANELYDHLIDPEENINLADRIELLSVIKELQNRLRLGWRYA